jgi:hypothetical protein
MQNSAQSTANSSHSQEGQRRSVSLRFTPRPVTPNTAPKVKSEARSQIFDTKHNFQPAYVDLTSDISDNDLASSEIIDLRSPDKFGTGLPIGDMAKSTNRLLFNPKKSWRDMNEDEDEPTSSAKHITEGSQMFTPSLRNTEAISKVPFVTWAIRGDKDRLIIAILAKEDAQMRAQIFDIFGAHDENELWELFERMFHALIQPKPKVRGMDMTTFNTLKRIIEMFEMYVDSKFYRGNSFSESTARKLEHGRHLFSTYYQLIQNARKSFIDANDDEEDVVMISEYDKRRFSTYVYLYTFKSI